jgi:hypothetical protein
MLTWPAARGTVLEAPVLAAGAGSGKGATIRDSPHR